MIKNIPEVISRFVIGFVFIESGWGKFHDLPKVVSFFESLGIPFANLQAPFVSAVELIAGLFILIGLKARLSSLPLMIIMLMALVTAKREDITDVSSLLGLSEFLYFVILAWIATNGAQLLSVDSWLSKRSKA